MRLAEHPAAEHAGHIAASLATPGARPSAQSRPVDPLAREPMHGRAVELADRIREIAASDGGATEAELRREGFTMAEIIEHLPAARGLLAETYVRNVAPAGDRVPEIIVKAIASAAHNMPQMAGNDVSEDGRREWRRFCQARAAFKIDPWVSQAERCIVHLRRFLGHLPILEREVNRVVTGLAADQKNDRQRIGQ